MPALQVFFINPQNSRTMNWLDIIEKYYEKDTPLYDILLSHSTSVCNKALQLGSRSGLPLDLQFVREAAMLHDIGIFLTDAPFIQCFGSHQYVEHGYLGAEILRREGFPAHALVCERHTGTGISCREIIERNLPLPHRDMAPVTLEEQLICYADIFYSKTRLEQETPIDKLRKKVAQWGAKSVAKFEEWHSMFGQ